MVDHQQANLFGSGQSCLEFIRITLKCVVLLREILNTGKTIPLSSVRGCGMSTKIRHMHVTLPLCGVASPWLVPEGGGLTGSCQLCIMIKHNQFCKCKTCIHNTYTYAQTHTHTHTHTQKHEQLKARELRWQTLTTFFLVFFFFFPFFVLFFFPFLGGMGHSSSYTSSKAMYW